MKHKLVRLALFALVVFSALYPQAAFSALIGDVETSIGNITYTADAGMGFAWGGDKGNAFISAINPIDGQDSLNLNTAFGDGSASVTNAEARAWFDSDDDAHKTSGTVEGNYTYTYGQSYAFYSYYKYFTVTNPGTVAVSADWYIYEDMETDIVGDEAYVNASVAVQIRNEQGYVVDGTTGARQQEFMRVYDGDSWFYEDSGTLTHEVTVPEEGTYFALISPFHDMQMTRRAVIPLPGAVWLLGSGLIGLVGLRKKLKK